jgi:hypothetical protein
MLDAELDTAVERVMNSTPQRWCSRTHALASDYECVHVIASRRTEADDDGSHKAEWGIFSGVSLQNTFSMPRASLGI